MGGKVVRYPSRLGKKYGRKVIFLLFLVLIVAGACLCLGQTITFWEARAELMELQSRRDALREENDLLREETILLQDQEYLEIQARKHLGMVRPGEIIFFVGD